MEKIGLICIGCPMGCSLEVEMENRQVISVQGNTCPRGDTYARKEVTHPTRMVTSTVRVREGAMPMVSCKTRVDIPKNRVFAVMAALKGVEVKAPVAIGDVLLSNAAGTGVDVIATRNVPAAR